VLGVFRDPVHAPVHGTAQRGCRCCGLLLHHGHVHWFETYPPGADWRKQGTACLAERTGVSRRPDAGGPIGLPGLEAVERQLDDLIAVLEAERRGMGSSVVKRPGWKNLVFAGAAGTGKSRTAAAVGHPAAELVGATRTETSTLVDLTAMPLGFGTHSAQSLPISLHVTSPCCPVWRACRYVTRCFGSALASPPAQVAEWAGHRCIDGQDQLNKRRIQDILREGAHGDRPIGRE
jgi:hypothetical protein